MSDSPARAGDHMGPYQLGTLLGRGGMGEVYQAVDTRKGRVIALKLLTPQLADDTAFRERFLRESQIAARLNDPHVVPIHDFGDIDGRLFIDMRLVEGHDLRTALKASGGLPAERAVAIIEQVASALDAAHRSGLIHRDVKPDNILLDRNDFAYLVDFGLAQAAGDSRLTSTGSAVGSFAYMAPERFGVTPAGPAADVYALACVLFECLSGAQPFSATSIEQLIGAHLHQAPPLLHNAFDGVIAQGMAKDPSARYPSAGALAQAARAAVSGSGVAASTRVAVPAAATDAANQRTMVGTPRNPSYPTAQPQPAQQKRSRLPLVLGAVIAVLVVALAGTAWALTRGSDAPSPSAETSATQAKAASTPADSTPTTTVETTTETTTADVPSAAVRGVGDLGLSTPITRPACDGSYGAFFLSATTPGQYAQDISASLAQHPGASYLRTDQACASLRQSSGGNAIYATYFPGDLASACATKARIGGGTYVRRLDDLTPVNTDFC